MVRRPTDPRAYKQLQKLFIDHSRRTRNPDGSYGSRCAICGREIDYRISHPNPKSASVDHVRSVKDHPHLVLEWSNLRCVHLVCNQRNQGDRRAGQADDDDELLDIGEPSERW